MQMMLPVVAGGVVGVGEAGDVMMTVEEKRHRMIGSRATPSQVSTMITKMMPKRKRFDEAVAEDRAVAIVMQMMIEAGMSKSDPAVAEAVMIAKAENAPADADEDPIGMAATTRIAERVFPLGLTP